MKITHFNKENYITFESREEIRIFSQFFYEHDYFIRKNFQSQVNYGTYIYNIAYNNTPLWIDNQYHNQLAFELQKNMDQYKRKNKLKRIGLVCNESEEGKPKKIGYKSYE
jgi:hypothetical protein